MTISHWYGRNSPSSSILQSPCSNTIQLPLGCSQLAGLVSISPRRDYFQTLAHSKFHCTATRSSLVAVGRHAGTPSHVRGNPLGLHLEVLARPVNTRCSARHISPLYEFFSTPATSFCTPATSSRQSASNSPLQQLLFARAPPFLPDHRVLSL